MPKEAKPETFRESVIAFVKTIPRGRVVSYGQVAAACGHPRAARQVGGILKAANEGNGKLPWWRVVNKKGEISIKGNWEAGKELQKSLLIKDGIKVAEDCTIDIGKYRFQK